VRPVLRSLSRSTRVPQLQPNQFAVPDTTFTTSQSTLSRNQAGVENLQRRRTEKRPFDVWEELEAVGS
jgi:hypothetical protein